MIAFLMATKTKKSRYRAGQNGQMTSLRARLGSDNPSIREGAIKQIRRSLERNDGNCTAAALEYEMSWFTYWRLVRDAKLLKYASQLRAAANLPGRH